MADGIDKVTAPVDADAVIWFDVPEMVVGRAVQLSEFPLASTPSGKVPAEQLLPFDARATEVVAATVPLPLTDKLAPVPITIAAAVFVPLVMSLKALEPPPPPVTVQSVLEDPELSTQVTPDPIKLSVGRCVRVTPSSATVL
jgi:hypothetical protein